MLKRRLKLLGKILLALVVLLVVFLLFERFRGQIALASYRRKLTAQGEKLSPQHGVWPISDEDNGAPTAVAAIERLQKGDVLPKSPPPRMRLLNSGRAIVGFREREWVDDKITNHWEQLATDLKSNTTVLAKILAALDKPVLNNHLDYSAVALKRYSLRHGKLPATLTALVPDFLTSVPVDYMDGKPIKYHLNADGSFILYSVGEDGKDDGGDLTLPFDSKSKDLWRRRDYV